MHRLRALSLASALLYFCNCGALETKQYDVYYAEELQNGTSSSSPLYSRAKYNNIMPRQEYRCQESNLQYDCVFHDVHIIDHTEYISFGLRDVTLNKQKKLAFKNSTVRTLPQALLHSFQQVELLNLSNLQMEQIELSAFETAQTVQELYMGSNSIHCLQATVFHNLSSLTVLALDGNNLTNLPRSIFSGTPNLNVLSMAYNKLERIEDETFQATKMLKYLRVSSNKLTHFDLSIVSSLFYGNVSCNRLTSLAVPVAVEELDASHNRINNVRGPINEKLAILKLQHNNLTDTAWLLSYPGLVDVNLSYNQLETLTHEHFVNMKRFERLYAANNRLKVLHLGSRPIPTLNVLDLSHNQLVGVEDNQPQFDIVEFLYLDHNSIGLLKLSSIHQLKDLTLMHNDWNCKSLIELFRNVSRSVADEGDQYCKMNYKHEHGFCCKERESSPDMQKT